MFNLRSFFSIKFLIVFIFLLASLFRQNEPLIPEITLSDSKISNDIASSDESLKKSSSNNLNTNLNKQTELSISLNENNNLTLLASDNNNQQIELKDDLKINLNTSNPNNSTLLSTNFRLRNDSFKQFTERFRSFSSDLFRSIELAHDMADLRNKKFSTATQTAATQLYSTNKNKPDHVRNVEEMIETTDENDNSFYQKNSSGDEFEKAVSMSSNEKYSLSPFASQNRASQKSDSPFDKAITNLNRNSIKARMYSDRIISSSLNKIDENEQQENNQTKDEKINNEQKDEPDYRVRHSSNKEIPDDIHISVWEVFIYLWGVITFFADLISDIILSIEYFNSSKFWLGFMTLMLVLVPNITLSLFSLSWYIDKYYSSKIIKETQNSTQPKEDIPIKPVSTCDSITFWITTILFVVFQIDLIWKYIQGLIYTIKGWACRSLYKNLAWEKYYIEKQIKCDTDIGMLRLIDVFMDSGPQVLLQLYVITTQNLNESGSANLIVFTFRDFKTTSLEFKQFFSILSSLLSMGYALAGYQRCLRNQQFIFCLETNKPLPRPMSWSSTIMQFIWYLFLIAPRVLSMAIFASTFRSWFFMIIFTHWLIMYFWILRLKTNYCITSPDFQSENYIYNAREEIFEKFYDFVCSFIYIFVYFNLKSGSTRYRYLIYYIIFYNENLIFSISYFFFSKEINLVYKLSMLLIVIIGFWVAITFQILYYLHCHPSHDIRICVRDSKGCISTAKKTKNKQFESLNKLSNQDDSSVYQLNTDQNKLKDNKFGKEMNYANQVKFINVEPSFCFNQNIINSGNQISEKDVFFNSSFKDKSLLSLSSASVEVSFSSILNGSQSNFNNRYFKNYKKNSFSKSIPSINIDSRKRIHSNALVKRLISDDSDTKQSNSEYSFLENAGQAPIASIKELLLIDEELSIVNEYLKKNCACNKKHSSSLSSKSSK